jgi:hypothetical protein
MLLEIPRGIAVKKIGQVKLVKYLKKTWRYPAIFRYIVFHMLQFNEEDRYTFAEVNQILETAENVWPSECIFDPSDNRHNVKSIEYLEPIIKPKYVVEEIRIAFPRPQRMNLACSPD